MDIYYLKYFFLTGLAFFILSGEMGLATDKSGHGISIIPRPQRMDLSNAEPYQLQKTSRIMYAGEDALHPAKMLAAYLEPATGYKLTVIAGNMPQKEDIFLSVSPGTKDMVAGSYKLESEAGGISIQASSGEGVFNGIQTLRQLLPVEIFSQVTRKRILWEVPAVRIFDYPRFGWRGMHLDVGRHFMPVSFIKKFLDEMALHKLNTFHWHLTEDQGWRIEIKKYPELTGIGAWRDETLIGHKRDTPEKYDGTRYGGFYTQDEIREIVEYARQRYINIVPEIEMPGHSQAAVTAYPEFGCTGSSPGVKTDWGISSHIYNPEEGTIDFQKDVLREVMELFPGEFIHIGGDEAKKDQWEASERIQELMKERGLADMHEMQSWFISQIDRFLTENNRRLIGWDEILEGGLAEGATVMSWRGESGGIEAARQGHDVVMASNKYLYFDHYQTEDKEKEPLAIGGFLPLEQVYSLDPVPAELSQDEGKHILGAQGQLWTEYIKTPEQVEYMAFPRLCALSELVWLENDAKDYNDFLNRLGLHLKRLEKMHINYRMPEELRKL